MGISPVNRYVDIVTPGNSNSSILHLLTCQTSFLRW